MGVVSVRVGKWFVDGYKVCLYSPSMLHIICYYLYLFNRIVSTV